MTWKPSAVFSLKTMQLSFILMWSIITWFYKQYNSYLWRSQVRLWTHNRHPIVSILKKNAENKLRSARSSFWWNYIHLFVESFTAVIVITSLTIVYSTVYWGADQRKHQSPASLAFVGGIHRWPVNSPHKWPVTGKCFHLMTSSCVKHNT